MDSKTEELKRQLRELQIETAEAIVVRRLQSKFPNPASESDPNKTNLRMIPAEK